MKRLILALTAFAAFGSAAFAAEQTGKPARPDIYDRNADGNKQIEEALKTSKAEDKKVLLQFGANWCGWCHKLHALFKDNADIAKNLHDNFVGLLVDVDQVNGQAHNQDVVQRYGNPTRFGLPAIVVLDSQGKQLTTQDTGKLEEGDHHDPQKVLAFLEQWKPKATAGN